MKIGILTYHRAHNYGALLQAYALRQFLRSQGHSVNYIDYWPEEHEAEYTWWKPMPASKNPVRWIKRIIYNLLYCIPTYRRTRKFKHFITRTLQLPAKAKYTQKEMPLNDGIEMAIVGSDQVWRNYEQEDLHIGYDATYYAQTLPAKTKAITYAVSMGIIKMDEQEKAFFSQAAGRFSSLLVREKELQTTLSNFGYSAEVVCDPTLLLSKEEWNKLLPTKRYHSKPYLLYYAVREDAAAYQLAQKIAKERNLQMIVIAARIHLGKFGEKQYEGPIDFIHAVRDADFVVATSFHGTAFSVIFERQFITCSLGKMADRAITLLSAISITDHYIPEPQKFSTSSLTLIPYNSTRELFNAYTTSSANHLAQSLR